MTEEELIERSQRRDAHAFARLVEEHTPSLYGFLRARAPQDLVADLAQETFLRAWRSVGEFRRTSSFRYWLYRIAQNLTINELKRRSRVSPWSDELADAAPTNSTVTDRLEAEAEQQDLRAAVCELPDQDREMIEFLYRDGLSYAEVGALTGMPVGTVKVRVHRARQRLRSRLESLWEGSQG